MPIPNDDAQPVFRSLADPTRRAVVMLLAEQDLSVGMIAKQFDMTRPAVAKHLGVLRDSGLISIHQHGRERINHLNPEALKAAFDWLRYFDRFWDDRLAALKDAVEKDNE
jgi:DNA-binding transcriptional ArsR family regulator